MTYKFSKKSLEHLTGVHPNLVKVVKRALELSTVDFSVNEGVRSKSRQESLVASKKSHTMHSKHLVHSDGYGHAIDLVPYPVSWELEDFLPIADAMQKSAKELGIKIRWGGSWCSLNQVKKPKTLMKEYSEARKRVGNKVFIDAPHFELI